MSDVKAYTKVSTLINDLRKSITREAIEDLFDRSKTDDLQDRIGVLREAMSVEDIYNSPSEDEINLEDDYEFELSIFIEGSWRLFS